MSKPGRNARMLRTNILFRSDISKMPKLATKPNLTTKKTFLMVNMEEAYSDIPPTVTVPPSVAFVMGDCSTIAASNSGGRKEF